MAVPRRAPLRLSRGLLRWLPSPARGLLRWLLGSPAPSLQWAQTRGWCIPRLRPLSTEDMRISIPRRPQLLLEEDCLHAVYSPSTMLASGSVASTAGVTVSAWGAGADSSAAGVGPSSATTVQGSSSSQVKSVDFLHTTQLVVNQVRLPNYMYYLGKIFTYKLDRTTVTVGAPSMLAMSTSLVSAGASSSASVVVDSSAAAAAAGSVLPSVTGACGTASVMAGAGLRLLSAGSPTVAQSPSSPWSTGSEGGISYKQQNFIVSIHNMERQVLDYSTRGAYLLRRSLGNLQFLGHALVCHVAWLPRRHRQTSLQTIRRILDEKNIGQSKAAESRPQLQPLLNLLWDFHKSGRRSRLGDKLHYVIQQQAH
jgi:hypothetical protein